MRNNMGRFIKGNPPPKTAFKKGQPPWNKNKKFNSKAKMNMSLAHIGNHHSEETKEKMSIAKIGEKHFNWKGGKFKDRKFKTQWQKEYRHRTGLSKKYICLSGLSHTKEYKKIGRQIRKALVRGGGKLTRKTIQLVYEDNIKRYGTLTCYLCLKPIEFGKDNLEHKTPLSRGGTNEYNNLAIACQGCNCKKGIKTETEYRKEKYDENYN